MVANVQSGHLVTGAEPYKPKATLWHKGSGIGNLHNQIIQYGNTSCVDCINSMIE